jgi:hypothetical protein
MVDSTIDFMPATTPASATPTVNVLALMKLSPNSASATLK